MTLLQVAVLRRSLERPSSRHITDVASPWQYNYPGETKPTVTTDQGYFANLPDQPTRNYRADENRHTAYLDNGVNQRHMWIHDISMNFQVAGSYAQSPSYRAWYPRNFVQPVIQIVGQTASQADYASLSEFIRQTQLRALRAGNSPDEYTPDLNTVLLHIPSGGRGNHKHIGHSLHGHIKNIQRISERWVNAPEFRFEFVVTTASAGLYETAAEDPKKMLAEIQKWMQPVAQQIYNIDRYGAQVDWATDPDNGPVQPGTVIGMGGGGAGAYPDKPPGAGQ